MLHPLAVPILALTLGHVFSNAVRTLPAIAADLLARDLAISPERLAMLTGAFPAAFALAMLPVGVALDRYGVRRTALALLAIGAVGALLAAAARGPWSMLLAQSVLGIGCSGMLMAPITFAARGMDARGFALWSGIVQTVGNSGMLLSASPLAWLIEAVGWRAGFLACAGIAVLALVAVAVRVPRDPATATRRSLAADWRETLVIARLPALLPLMVLALPSFAVVLGIRGLWGGPWLMEAKGMDRLSAGDVLLGCTVALTVAPVLAGAVARALRRPTLLLAAGHAAAAAVLLLIVLGGPGAAMLPVWWDAMLLIAFGFVIAFQVVMFAEARAVVAPAQTGRALSALNIAFFGGAALLQALSGVAATLGGLPAALLTYAVALAAGVVAFLALRRSADAART